MVDAGVGSVEFQLELLAFVWGVKRKTDEAIRL